MATAEKRVVTEATGQAMLAELRKIPGVMNPVPVEKGGTGVTTPEEILELIGAQPKLPIDVVEELGATVKSVNQVTPDEHGNVQLLHVAVADNLSSDEATVVNGTFIERTTGGDASIQDGSANLGVLYGYSIRQGYSAESHRMQVIPVGRLDDSVIISAEINWDTYRTAVNNVSTNKTFTYGANGWNENPATYGIEITGTPASGDVINVYFIAENRGTIVNTTPETFVETNWNLYDPTTGICRVLKYSDEYGFKIGGSYTGVSFATTRDAEQKTVITPDSDGLFDIPEDGYLFVTGGNDTDTYILMTWSDWGDGYTGDFEVHSESVVDFSELMSNTFPFGMCAIGIVMDEINFSDKAAYVRIERVAYTTEARIAAENSGRAFTFDDEWIYQVKETPDRVRFNIDNSMVVYDHGTEFFTGTDLPVTVYQLFGQNLKDKLRREVVAVTPQNFSVAQKRIARENIEAAWDPEVIKTINHKTPDQYGDITIVEGTANASYGLYRINAVIQPAAWSLVNGAYQVAYADPLIKSDMDGMETWLDDPSAMLGKTRFSTIDGALIISTAVQPVDTWNLHVALGTNGSTVLEQVYNKAEENAVALVEHDDTAFHNIAAGQYVLWKGALYKASSAITAGDTLAATGNSANLTAKSNGIGNELKKLISDNFDYTTKVSEVVKSSIDDVKSYISTTASNMVSGESKLIRIVHINNNETDIMKPHVRYEGFLYKVYNSAFSWFGITSTGRMTLFSYNDGTWTTDAVLSRNNIKSEILPDGVKITDCNDAIDQNKSYYVETSAANKPAGVTSWLLIKVIGKSGSAYITQVASEENVLNGRMWYRTKSSSAWGDWHLIAQEDKTIVPQGSLAGVDLNNVGKTGLYMTFSGATANGPSDYHDSFMLLHYNTNTSMGDVKLQIFIPWSSSFGYFYIRTYVNSSWNVWAKYAKAT